MLWTVLLLIGAVISFSLGWPRQTFAAEQSTRGRLLWIALTFVLPWTVGVIVGWVAERQNKTSEVAFGVGFVLGGACSFVAVLLGTLTANAVRRRVLGRHS